MSRKKHLNVFWAVLLIGILLSAGIPQSVLAVYVPSQDVFNDQYNSADEISDSAVYSLTNIPGYGTLSVTDGNLILNDSNSSGSAGPEFVRNFTQQSNLILKCRVKAAHATEIYIRQGGTNLIVMQFTSSSLRLQTDASTFPSITSGVTVFNQWFDITFVINADLHCFTVYVTGGSPQNDYVLSDIPFYNGNTTSTGVNNIRIKGSSSTGNSIFDYISVGTPVTTMDRPIFTDGSGTILTNMTDTVSCHYTHPNPSELTNESVMIIGLYNKSNSMLEKVEIVPVATKQFSAPINVSGTPSDYYMRGMVWDGLQSMMPLSLVNELR